LAWSDPTVQALAAEFIPAAENIDYNFQGRTESGMDLLRKVLRDASLAKEKKIGQGFYAVTPSGRTLGAMVNGGDRSIHKPQHVAAMMKEALATWEKLTLEQRLLPMDFALPKIAIPAAPAGMVLRITSRDLPRASLKSKEKTHWDDLSYRNDWGQKYVELSKKEALALLPSNWAVGSRYEIPQILASRIARVWLVDNVHGYSRGFEAEEDLKKAKISAQVLEVKDGLATVLLQGETLASHRRDGPTGYDAKLRGRIVYALKEEKIVSFELVAVGSRWGYLHHSNRGPRGGRPPDEGPAPMGVVCTRVDKSPFQGPPGSVR